MPDSWYTGLQLEGEWKMIIYDLRCAKSHNFEGWFKDRSAFEEQKTGKLITCPVCGSSDVAMVPSSISILGKEIRNPEKQGKEFQPPKALQLFHEFLDKNFEEVGTKFTEIALKIKSGEEEKRNIKGTTTKEEEEILKEAGVEFVKIPVPKFDS